MTYTRAERKAALLRQAEEVSRAWVSVAPPLSASGLICGLSGLSPYLSAPTG